MTELFHHNIYHIVCFLLVVIGIVLFVPPMVAGIVNIGNLTGLAFFLLTALALELFPRIRSYRGATLAFIIFASLCSICVLTGLALSALMIINASDKSDDSRPLVVLGCKVNGSTPSLMLHRRIDAAYEYLIEYPEAICVASGARGIDEDISEAQAICTALVERGIEPERILLESTSVNTDENISFSTELLKDRIDGFNGEIAIASDFFHIYRAQLIAEKGGITASACPASTPAWLLPTYWCREWFALVEEILLK